MAKRDANTSVARDPIFSEVAGAPSVDAMGRDKRRKVAGGTYGPTRARIAVRFAIFFAVVIALLVAAKIAVDELDKPPDKISDEAPWAQPDSPQRDPKPIQ
jgi:hypothetical protein